MASSKELKSRMAVPPIPQAPRKDRHGPRTRDRTRIRMEISPEQCTAFVAMLRERLVAMDRASEDFKPLYGIYFAMKSQMEKLNKKMEASNGE